MVYRPILTGDDFAKATGQDGPRAKYLTRHDEELAAAAAKVSSSFDQAVDNIKGAILGSVSFNNLPGPDLGEVLAHLAEVRRDRIVNENIVKRDKGDGPA